MIVELGQRSAGIGDFLILKILRESSGGAIAVYDEEMIRIAREVGANEGSFVRKAQRVSQL